MYRAAIALVVFAVPAWAADEPAKPSAELKVLEDMVGNWDETVSNKATELAPQAGTMTAVTKRAWTMGGAFIRGEGTWKPHNTEFLHLQSYDVHAKCYRSYYFDSSNTMPREVLRGAWDAKTKTLTWTGTDEIGNKTLCKHKIVDKDHNDWTMTITDPGGKVVLDLTGKCVRRKDAAK